MQFIGPGPGASGILLAYLLNLGEGPAFLAPFFLHVNNLAQLYQTYYQWYGIALWAVPGSTT